MANDVIKAAAVQSTPAGYQVPAAQVIGVISVKALIDGSGAGAAFLPTLQLVSPAGDVVWESAQDSTVAAGGSASACWFPGVAAAASAAPSTGAVITADAVATGIFTWGPGVTSPNLAPIATNDSSVFSNRGGFPKQILVQHGGVFMSTVAIEFNTNGGIAYSGLFDGTVDVFDSLNNPVGELAGPPIWFAELYATNPADNFFLSGFTLHNADDGLFTPPYHVAMTFENSVNSTATSARLTVSILNPTGLT